MCEELTIRDAVVRLQELMDRLYQLEESLSHTPCELSLILLDIQNVNALLEHLLKQLAAEKLEVAHRRTEQSPPRVSSFTPSLPRVVPHSRS